jgi:hypothetical protein
MHYDARTWRAEGKNMLSQFRLFLKKHLLALRPYLDNMKTYSEIRYNLGPKSFLQILFVLLYSTHFKALDGSENR